MAQSQQDVWYFAIGSMMNPISLRCRNLYPRESYPAIIFDFYLHFFGSMGFAEAVLEVGRSFHGVVHKMTASDMLELDKIERGYIKYQAKVKRYGIDEEIVAVVYGRSASNEVA